MRNDVKRCEPALSRQVRSPQDLREVSARSLRGSEISARSPRGLRVVAYRFTHLYTVLHRFVPFRSISQRFALVHTVLEPFLLFYNVSHRFTPFAPLHVISLRFGLIYIVAHRFAASEISARAGDVRGAGPGDLREMSARLSRGVFEICEIWRIGRGAPSPRQT